MLPVDVDAAYIKDCEFLQLVNRGELSLPLQSIYKLALYSYSYFKLIDNKECAMKVIHGFREVYEILGLRSRTQNLYSAVL